MGVSVSAKPFNFCTSRNRRLLVADILAVEEEEEEEDGDLDSAQEFGMGGIGERRREGSTISQCLSPRRIIGRWIASLRRAKERRVEKECNKIEEEARRSGGGSTSERCLMDGFNGGESSSPGLDTEKLGLSWRDGSFNLGIGCSLLYILFSSKNELSKIVELRSQMETLLQNVKEGLEKKDGLFKPFQSSPYLSCSSSDLQYDSRDSNYPPKSELPEEGGCVEVIDELEAEFEVEFERLQLYLEAEDSSEHSSAHLRIKNAKEIKSFMNSGEVIDPQEEDVEMQNGVSPVELQGRLYELAEARHQERIKELETALEIAKKEIREKEMEISRWKDAAKNISQHVQKPSKLDLACEMQT